MRLSRVAAVSACIDSMSCEQSCRGLRVAMRVACVTPAYNAHSRPCRIGGPLCEGIVHNAWHLLWCVWPRGADRLWRMSAVGGGHASGGICSAHPCVSTLTHCWPAGVSPACIVPPIGGLLAVGRWGGWLDSTRSCASVCEPPWWQPPVSSRDVAELKRCLPHSTPLWGALIQRALWRSTRWRCMPQCGFLHCGIVGGCLLPIRRQLLHHMRDGTSRYIRL